MRYACIVGALLNAHMSACLTLYVTSYTCIYVYTYIYLSLSLSIYIYVYVESERERESGVYHLDITCHAMPHHVTSGNNATPAIITCHIIVYHWMAYLCAHYHSQPCQFNMGTNRCKRVHLSVHQHAKTYTWHGKHHNHITQAYYHIPTSSILCHVHYLV